MDIIRNTAQRGDPEEMAHLRFHLGTLFPDDIQTLNLEKMVTNIVDPFMEKDHDKMEHLYFHFVVLLGCKILNPAQ